MAALESSSISLVRDDPLFRLQRAVGLIPAEGLGIGRRVLLLSLVAWLPIAVWAFWRGRVLEGALDEPLLEHFGVHIRCLVAIPLLIAGEGVAHAVLQRTVPQFLRAGIVADPAAFDAVLQGVARLRNRTLPWIIIAAVVLAWSFLTPLVHSSHEVLWAIEPGEHRGLGFGGWWYLYVVRSMYVALVLAWLWRIMLLCVLLRRLARLRLSLVPTHPDRCGGLGFLETLPTAFTPVALALSAVLASGWAHDVVYHEATLQSLRLPALAFLVLVALLFLGPLLLFAPPLMRLKKHATLEYAALVGEHGRAVDARWIKGRPIAADEPLLSAPEIGPVADTHAIYEAVVRMRPAPISTKSVAGVLGAAVLPMIVVVALQVPLKEVLLKLLKALA